MSLKMNLIVVAFIVSTSLGCSQTEPSSATTATATTAKSAKPAQFLLASAPDGAKQVIEARKEAKDGEDILIEGRIGGAEDPWVEGRAAFQIVDRALVPCNEKPGDNCPKPWDYCCDTDRLPTSKALVKFVDDSGKTLPTDARKLLGVKELQTVVIKGKAKRDEAGNLTVLASGMFVRPQAAAPQTGKEEVKK